MEPQSGDARGLALPSGRSPLPVNVPKLPLGDPVVRVLTLDDFQGLKGNSSNELAVHLKGFNRSVCDCYHEEILQRLSDCTLLVWDGLLLNETGFTALVPQFLRQAPHKRVCAFKNVAGISNFMFSWAPVAREFPGRVSVVALNPREIPDSFAGTSSVPQFGVENRPLGALESSLDGMSQEVKDQMRLARIALKASSAKQVLCLGGPGVHGREAEACFADGVRWTVFACSRGLKEDTPSLMDWAATMASQRPAEVELVTGRDPMEADGFAGSMPATGPTGGSLDQSATNAVVGKPVADEAAAWTGQLPGAMEARTPKHDKAFERLRQKSGSLRTFTDFGAEEPAKTPMLSHGLSIEAAAAAKTKPDMSGTWIAFGAPEGLDSFLELNGMGWLARKAVQQVMKNFTPKMVITCEGDGEKFLVVNHTPKGLNTTEFLTNGEEFEGFFGPEKESGKGTAHWEGEKLKLVVQMKGMTTETTRFLEGRETLLENIKATKNGKSAVMSRRWKPPT